MWNIIRYLFVSVLMLNALLAEGVNVSPADDTDEVNASIIEERKYNLRIVKKDYFLIENRTTKKIKKLDLKGKPFILISVREPKSDGRFYAVDRDATVWWTGPISSGAKQFATPSGVFKVLTKIRYHMSSLYPSEDGVNNMNYTMRFSHDGLALHEGSTEWMSHGCIHISKKDVPVMYRWVKKGMPIVVTRESYMPFAKEDLQKIYQPVAKEKKRKGFFDF